MWTALVSLFFKNPQFSPTNYLKEAIEIMAKQPKASSNSSRRTFMATSLATAAVAAGSTSRAATVTPSPLFPVLKHPDSPLTVDLSTVVNPLLNEQIPRWVDPIVFPKWLPPMSTGSLPQHYSSAVGDVHHGVAPEWFDHPSDWDRFPVQYYEMHHMTGAYRFLPSTMKIPATNFWGYAGRAADGSLVPTALPPMFRFRIGQPAIVRMANDLPDEMSLHMHGGHWPAHSDGHPNFLIMPGAARDYYYPNIVPRKQGGNAVGSPFDYSESVSTMWYHDHAVHLTAAHVARGCGGGMAPTLDDLEIDLIKSGVLPGIRGVSDVGPEYQNPYDLPLVIRDDIFDTSGQVQYVSNGHNGYLGNVIRVNGLAYPHMKVEARKYRFRVLIASNARCFRLRLSDNSPFMRIAKDAWLFPKPQQTQAFLGYPALRADIVIDFSKYKPGTEIYLENILPQMDPRGPTSKLEDENGTVVRGVPRYRHRMLKFIVGPRDTRFPDATLNLNSSLRPHTPILASEVTARRTFNFERKNGAWAINGQFWNEALANAIPKSDSVEEWTLKNGGGGWWHPIHIHLESHVQVADLRTKKPIPYHDSFKSDTTMLGPNSEIVVRMKFRTFKGPFVFHCHNIEHEDQDMMLQFDPRAVVTGDRAPQAWYP